MHDPLPDVDIGVSDRGLKQTKNKSSSYVIIYDVT